MALLINNRNMPNSCEDCLFYGVDVENGCFLEKCFCVRKHGQDRPSWCPLFGDVEQEKGNEKIPKIPKEIIDLVLGSDE